jgi:uncharacterized Tic20 family protein
MSREQKCSVPQTTDRAASLITHRYGSSIRRLEHFRLPLSDALEGTALADQPLLSSLPIPTEDERTMAFLAHLLQVFAGFIGPLIIYCVKQDSRFVRFHALQALVWQICYMLLIFGGMFLFFIAMIVTAFQATSGGHPSNELPPLFLFVFPVFWLIFIFGWIANVILGVAYGIKAKRGEWAGYPVIGKFCLPKLAPAAPTPGQTWMP